MKVLSRKDLKALGIIWCNVHLRRQEDAGQFPRRIYLGKNTCVWDEREIHEWLESKAAERQPEAKAAETEAEEAKADTRKRRRRAGGSQSCLR